MLWNQTYGGTDYNEGHAVIQTVDGGFALVGDIDNSFGARDIWLVKTDANGVMLWNQKYGSSTSEVGRSVIQTVDGGFALVGISYKWDDMWLVKTDANGVMLWNQTYGGTEYDKGHAVIQTVDGGFALAGSTCSDDKGYDMYLVKTDANGVTLWNQTYGGTNSDWAFDLVQTADGGFALVGFTESYGAGGSDMYLVKTDPNGVMLWNQTYGGTEFDEGRAVIQTFDGGFALAGVTSSFGTEGIVRDFDKQLRTGNIWLVKTDSNGTIQPSSTPTTPSSTTISSSTPPRSTTPGWGPISLFVAAVVPTTWYKRLKGLK
ncbi:MAG: hypothetical protein ACFE95_15545 [Candidatus Hodarchaeota archaeon]